MKRILLIIMMLASLQSEGRNALADIMVGGKIYTPAETLDEMVAKVKQMYESGAPRQEIAKWMTHQLDARITNMNSPELIFDTRNLQFWKSPIPGSKLFDDHRAKNIYENDYIANWAWDNQMGNCEEHANITYYILKHAGVKEPFRMLNSGKHAFTVWGMKPGCNLNRPETWGKGAVVVDSWMGYTLDADDVNEHRYFKNGDADEPLNDQSWQFDKEAPKWVTDKENKEDDFDEDCFVVTAVYGRPLALEVQTVRRWRDNVLINYAPGKWFISGYEKWGPMWADWLNRHASLKPKVREWLIEPLLKWIKGDESEKEEVAS